MMPELSLADALGAVGKPIHRVHTAGSVGASTAITGATLVESRPLRARAGRLLREAVRGQRHVGAVGRSLRRPGRGRHVRAVDPQLHPAVRRARAHRLEGRGQGPAQRAEEPVRAPADRGHLDREGEGVPDAVGPAALPRVVPVVGRRGGGRARQRGRRPKQAPRPPAWVIAHAKRTEFGSFPGRDTVQAAGGRRLRRGALREGRHHRPAAARSTAPSSTCRSRGTSPCGSRATSSPPKARAGS